MAVTKCLKAEGRVETCEILTDVLDHLSLEMPMIAPLFGIMDHASFCADLATQNEAKAYALAYYNRLTTANQAAFLGYVQGRAAA